MGIDPYTSAVGTYEVLTSRADINSAVIPTTSPNLDILPANLDLIGAEIDLVETEQREMKLQKELTSIKDQYDFIVIDCAPSLGLVTLNALTAADSVIIRTM